MYETLRVFFRLTGNRSEPLYRKYFLGTRAFLAGPTKTIPGGSGCCGDEGVVSSTASPVAGKKNVAGRCTGWPLTLADAMRRLCEPIIRDKMADRLLIILEEPQRLLEDL